MDIPGIDAVDVETITAGAKELGISAAGLVRAAVASYVGHQRLLHPGHDSGMRESVRGVNAAADDRHRTIDKGPSK